MMQMFVINLLKFNIDFSLYTCAHFSMILFDPRFTTRYCQFRFITADLIQCNHRHIHVKNILFSKWYQYSIVSSVFTNWIVTLFSFDLVFCLNQSKTICHFYWIFHKEQLYMYIFFIIDETNYFSCNNHTM